MSFALGDGFKERDYSDGRTKQSFKDECDINKILYRFAKTGTLSHVAKYGGEYAEFGEFNFHDAQNKLARGLEIFESLPGEIRREFGQDPARFFAFVNDPENADKLHTVLPGIAKPGNQLPAARRTPQNVPADPPPPASPPSGPPTD